MTQQRKTRVLVTGATGFLGSAALRALMQRRDVEPIAACRSAAALDPRFGGEIRIGDLRDPAYRAALPEAVDVLCHCGTWSAFWGHARMERTHFFEPAIDLIEQSLRQGVKRFLLASTVAIGQPGKEDAPRDDFSPTRYTGFWPHLDRLIDVDNYMRDNSGRGMQMVNMRLGHFVGAGNRLGLVPALVPRLRTYMVPWLERGRGRMPLVGDSDLGEAFALAATAAGLDDYESFNICGPEFPSAREVIEFIADQSGSPRPWFSVPYPAAYAFAWLMELLHPVLPGSTPFLTRSLVHVAEGWVCPSDHARARIGYVPGKDWRVAVSEALMELKDKGFPWMHLAQAG